MATDSLTTEERAQIQHRMEIVNVQTERGKEPKWKMPDPRDWDAAADLDEEEINPETQEAFTTWSASCCHL